MYKCIFIQKKQDFLKIELRKIDNHLSFPVFGSERVAKIEDVVIILTQIKITEIIKPNRFHIFLLKNKS